MRPRPSSPRTETARRSGFGPTEPAAPGSSLTAHPTSFAEADFIIARLRSALAEDLESVAVLYRTNAQSRAIEDALLRDGLGYKILGGVRFYERQEVKDALAYLKLIFQSAR